ncbi:hypothetical protein OAO52_06555 [Flavobacteriaceae bacterium]|nr:hypothetical protein [Flavobacteriaceae bacterium]
MKKIILLVAVITIYSCSGGDDNNSNSINKLIVDGVEYPLESGTLLNYGSEGGIYNIDLDIQSPGIVVSDCTENSAIGQGQNIYFEMWTSEPDFLDSMTYSIVDEEFLEVGNITTSDYILNYDSDLQENNWTIISSGSVDVQKSGNNYTISWNLTGALGEVITGNYSGTLMYCDVSN